jgi:hypothetical protein
MSQTTTANPIAAGDFEGFPHHGCEGAEQLQSHYNTGNEGGQTILLWRNDSDGGNFRRKTGVKLACKPVFGWKFTSEESPMLLVRLNPDKKMLTSEQLLLSLSSDIKYIFVTFLLYHYR